MKRFIFPIFEKNFRSKIRYKILVLTLMPIILTLLSLIIITIYWNITYTAKQLFLEVGADLRIVKNGLQDKILMQNNNIKTLLQSWDFRIKFNEGIQEITPFMEKKRKELNLDFLRIVPSSVVEADDKLNQFVLISESGLMVLDSVYNTIPNNSKVLTIRSIIPISDKKNIIKWYIDAGLIINNNKNLVDELRDLNYTKDTLFKGSVGAVTIFLNDVRIASNVTVKEANVGSKVSDRINKSVMEEGKSWVGRSLGYIAAYEPLYDSKGKRIGIIFTGFSEKPFIISYIRNVVEMGSLLLFILIISGFLVYRGVITLLKPIEKIHQVVKGVKQGKELRIGNLELAKDNELAELAKQFDSMLDLLKHREEEIRKAAEDLEEKVSERTISLFVKTRELEKNVQLLNETRQQLVTNEKLTALGELTAGIAHEINNPTAVILGNMELLKYELGEDADKVSDEITNIISQVGRISTIVRSLLQYSRPGDLDAPLELQEINTVIEEMLILVRHSIKKQYVIITPELKATQKIKINRAQILQVLINLVVNASHAITEKGQIWIKSYNWMENGVCIGVKIEVIDKGKGIAKGDLNRIFDPFYTTRQTGTGLGLSLSYGIIKRLGGIIEVESKEGYGSTFTIGLYTNINETSPYLGLQINK